MGTSDIEVFGLTPNFTGISYIAKGADRQLRLQSLIGGEDPWGVFSGNGTVQALVAAEMRWGVPRMCFIIERVQVNIPFAMLYETFLPRFLEHGINPEVGFDAAAMERFSHADFKSIADRLHSRDLRITVHGPFMDLSSGSPDPAVRAVTRHRFEQLLDLVALFRPKTVVCHTGYDHKRYGYIRESWIEKSIEMWSWLGSRTKDQGARLMLENVYEHGPEDIRVLFEALAPEGVGFCLDTGHQSAFSLTPLEIWTATLGPYLGQLHLHDNSGKEDEHLALGLGNIDFPTLLRNLRSTRKDPPVVTLEPHREEDLWPSLRYLEEHWPW
jgi:sugar phosphate isomerase/epimerase